MELKISAEELVELLKNSVLHITFTKADGNVREMNATLQSDYLPKRPAQTLLQEVPYDANVVRVWDVDLEGWRSVRVDRINQVLRG